MARVRRTFRYQEIPCRRCGTPFKATRIDAMWCPSCKAIRRKEISASAEQRYKRPCSVCGTSTGRRSALCLSCANTQRAAAFLGENNPNWRGGRIIDNQGYAHIRVKPSGPHPYRREHHVVWEKTHDKPLPKRWVVHHLNGVRDDNRPENLLGISRRDHHIQHRAYEERIRQLENEVRIVGAWAVKGLSDGSAPYVKGQGFGPHD